MKIIKFKATNSGDGESFCFDVDRETFISIANREPESSMDYQSGEYIEQDDNLIFVPDDINKCRIYPNDIFGGSHEKIEVELRITTL